MMKINEIESTLRSLKKSHKLPHVKSWKVEEGQDATDNTAIWIWITVDDKHINPAVRAHLRDVVRHKVREGSENHPWVYVRFRSVSEGLEV